MAYADTMRAATATLEIIAGLIEGIASSGYPLTWSTWSPTYGASGSMTFTSVSTTHAKYFQIGKFVVFKIHATGTTGGTASNAISVSLPVPCVGQNHLSGGSVTDGGSGLASAVWATNVAIYFYKYDSSNYALGASRQIVGTGIYEAS